MTSAPLYLGVDGGATHSRARLRDGEGRLLEEASGAAANIHVDFDAAVAALGAVTDEVLAKAQIGSADRGRIAIGLGLAGFKQGSDAARVEAAFPRFRLVRAANDATTACIGAHAGADGGLVIAGTGSAAIARVDGRETIIGGRGFALGDDGSASHIGLEAMRAYDGLAPKSALTEAILARFGGDPVAMMTFARDAKPGDFGAFAPAAFDSASAHDPVALAIVSAAARAIGGLTRRVLALGAARVALVGGVGDALRPYFEPDVAPRLSAPVYDATDGAILFVGGAVAPHKETAP